MNIFQELGNIYSEINNIYSQNEFEARRKNHCRRERFWARKKELNDHAYFLFMFTRLEDRIRKQSGKLILRKQKSLRGWKQRSVWDILQQEKGNIAKAQFSQVIPNGNLILSNLITDNILDNVSSTEVRLIGDLDQDQDRIRTIAGNDYIQIMEILEKPDKRPDNIHFKKRLALLTDRSGQDYERVVEYYDLRNKVAHGGKLNTPVVISLVVSEFEALYYKLVV